MSLRGMFGNSGGEKKKGDAGPPKRKKRSSMRKTIKPGSSSKVKRPSTVKRPGKSVKKRSFGAPQPDGTHKIRTSMKNKQIGQLLRKKDIISEPQLTKALKIQQETGGLLGQILVEMEACDRAAIGSVIKKQRTITTVFLEVTKFDPEAVVTFSRDFCTKNRLVPFEKLGNTLCLAMGNVLDATAKNEAKEISSLQLKVFDASWPDIEKAIAKHIPENAEAAPHASASESGEVEVVEDLESLVIELPGEESSDTARAIISNEKAHAIDAEEILEIEEDAIEEIEELPADGAIKDGADDAILEIEEIEEITPIETAASTPPAAREAPKPAPAPTPKAQPAPPASLKPASTPRLPTPDNPISRTPAVGVTPLPGERLRAIPMEEDYFRSVIHLECADPERRWVVEHLAQRVLPVAPATDMKVS